MTGMSPVSAAAGAQNRAADPPGVSAARSGAVMAAGTVASRVLGLVRTALLAAAILKRTLGAYGGGHVFDVHVRLIIAAMVAALAGAALCLAFGGYDAGGYVWQARHHAVVVLAAGGSSMAAVYLGMLRLLRVAELGQVTGLLRSRFAQRT